MAFQTWQVGLDIQNGQICALAIQRRRNGWQLRHWWRHALPHDTLTNGLVQRPEPVIALLQHWRRQLPYRLSLRVGFPPQLVLQRSVELPGTQLREPERSNYITAAARRFFPIEPETLALDYRAAEGNNGQLWLTAARHEAVQSWQHCFRQAKLQPDIFELTPAALRALAQGLQLNPASALVHRLTDHWLWFPAGQQTGWCAVEEAPDFAALRCRYLPDTTDFYYSSAVDTDLPDNTKRLNPLDAFAFKQLPLPLSTSEFALAAGLALRPGDTDGLG